MGGLSDLTSNKGQVSGRHFRNTYSPTVPLNFNVYRLLPYHDDLPQISKVERQQHVIQQQARVQAYTLRIYAFTPGTSDSSTILGTHVLGGPQTPLNFIPYGYSLKPQPKQFQTGQS